jgi:hypothetical protein
MFHKKRKHKIYKCDNVDKLALQLGSVNTLCSGFDCKGVLFLNDSISEDGAQEYAVVLPVKDGQGLQVESVTYGWIDNIEERKKSILGMLHYKEAPGDAPIYELVELRIQDHSIHSCALCQ